MPYTVSFLDRKLYQSLSFDSDIRFPESCDFIKKFWILKEYKKQGADVTISESQEQKEDGKRHSSYEIQKRFKGDELIVEIVQSLIFSDNFDFFAKAEFDLPTGDIELDKILKEIKGLEFNQVAIAEFILSGNTTNFDFKGRPSDKVLEIFGITGDHQFGDFKQDSPPTDPEETSSE
tara:strand:- start:9 stop:539 length:531 start_codon:yes stop_codon:yes gene_type:complete